MRLRRCTILLERSARQWAQALNAEQGNHDSAKQSAAVTGKDEIDIGRLVGTVIEARWWASWGRRVAGLR